MKNKRVNQSIGVIFAIIFMFALVKLIQWLRKGETN